MNTKLTSLLLLAAGSSFCADAAKPFPATDSNGNNVSVLDSIVEVTPMRPLQHSDYEKAAKKLGCDVAAIKAVVLIEAGHDLKGFTQSGLPIINFDLNTFRKRAKKRGVNIEKYRKSHKPVFQAVKSESHQQGQHIRLASALDIDSVAAIEGTFWGMFQIAGFNWDKCGTKSPMDFMEKMSYSEQEQLSLFVNFIKSNKLDRYLRSRDWKTFAQIYNGPLYYTHHYDTRLAAAYNKFKAGR